MTPSSSQSNPALLRAMPRLLLAFGFGLAYCLAAQAGHLLSFESGKVATFWPPSGLFLMVLTIAPPRQWLYYLSAAALANIGSDLINHKPLLFSLAMTLANILEASLGAWFLNYKASEAFSLDRSLHVKRLLIVAAVAPLISGLLPSMAALGLGIGRFQEVYLVWWLADCVGIILIAPIVWAMLAGPGLQRQTIWRSVELILCLTLVTVCTLLVFSDSLKQYPFPFILIPLLYWPALRFGTLAVACHTAIMAVIITLTTREGIGAFAIIVQDPSHHALVIQAFLATISGPFLLMAALWHERVMEAEDLERRIGLRTQQLAEADRRKDHFLAVLAHELRNPLAPLSHALDMWPSATKDPQRLDELRQVMTSQVRHMAGLIDDLLDVSRIAGGKILLRQETIDMCDVVRTAMRTAQSQAEQAGHVVRLQLPNKPILVRGDRARLCQIVGNLLNNAIKYTGSEGVIKVYLQQIGANCEVRVEDNGPGIPQQDLRRIFELFTQVDQTLERAHGGLGIGLTLVQNLVELHGGTVEATSPGPGQGSCFIVQLPCLESSQSSQEVNHHPQPAMANNNNDHLPKRRILVVDDTSASGRMLCMLLKSLGQQVELCFDGPTALETVAAFEPSLIFLDIAMPGMNGYEVATQLKSNPATAPITLVAMTGFGQESDRQRAFASGFDHHLIKPATLEALKQVIREPVAK